MPEPKSGVDDRAGVVKTFRAFDPDQVLLLPPSLDDWLPSGHLARFVADLVDEHLDLSAIHAAYKEGRGAPPYDPRLMVRTPDMAAPGCGGVGGVSWGFVVL